MTIKSKRVEAIIEELKDQYLRQFGIRLEQRELIGILNTIPLNSLRFVVEETICSKCSDITNFIITTRLW